MLAVWSAREDRKFEKRLRYGRFTVQVEHVRGRLKKGGPHHTIFLGFVGRRVSRVEKPSGRGRRGRRDLHGRDPAALARYEPG